MADLAPYVGQMVTVVTNDGRVFVGTLKGFDQTTNIILEHSQERLFSAEEGVELVPVGLYLLRGDNISVVGELDVAADAAIDWSSIKVDPLPSLSHT